MKIINYSDKNIILNGYQVEQTEFYYPTETLNNITHNSLDISNLTDGATHIFITNTSSGYEYETFNFSPPPIFETASILITYFGFFFTIKLIQKIKTQ